MSEAGHPRLVGEILGSLDGAVSTVSRTNGTLPPAEVVWGMDPDEDDGIQVWLVERTYSDDELNLIILTYATPDGERYFRKERALTSFSDVRETTAALTVDESNLGRVTDPDRREQFSAEAERMRSTHDPDDPI